MGETAPPHMSRIDQLKERINTYRNWVEPLVGRTCSRVVVDRYDPPLVLWFLYDRPEAWVSISSSFRLVVGKETFRIDPYRDRLALTPVLALIERTVTDAVAAEDGGLRLQFDDGAVIEVDCSDPDSEPWWFDMHDEADS